MDQINVPSEFSRDGSIGGDTFSIGIFGGKISVVSVFF